jgi:hypothetical protein
MTSYDSKFVIPEKKRWKSLIEPDHQWRPLEESDYAKVLEAHNKNAQLFDLRINESKQNFV